MENYGKALEYAGVAADSAGTALEKFSAYEDSIGAKAASFTAALESLTMDTIDSNLVKDLIDAGTAVVEFAEKVGLLKAALISLGAGGVIKGVSLISSGFKTAYHEVLNLGTAINTMRNVDTVGGLSADTLTKLGKLTKGLSDEQLKLVLTSKQLSAAQMKAILMASGLSEAEAAQKIETLGLAASESAATGATFDPPPWWCLGCLSSALVGVFDKRPFSCNKEAAVCGGLGEAFHHVRHGLLQCGGIQAATGDALPGNLVVAPGDGVHLAGGHLGFDGVLEAINLALQLLSHAAKFPQFLNLAVQFDVSHNS